MVLSEAYLKSLRGGKPPVQRDRSCRRCGYNLKGLPGGSVCPECGTPSRDVSIQGRFNDNLTDAPLEYLRTLRGGLLLLAGSVLFLVAALIMSFFIGIYALIGAAVVSCVLWIPGVWITTSPRSLDDSFAPDAVLDSARLRNACRSLQVATLIGGLMFSGSWIVSQSPTASSGLVSALVVGAAIFYGIAILALIPLSVYLSAMSDWAGHDQLGMQFRIVSFTIAIAAMLSLGAVLAGVASPGVRGLAALVTLWSGIGIVLALMFFLTLILRLANSARWAVTNALNALESQARIAERKKEHADRVVARQLDAQGTPEGHGGSWADTGFIALTDEDDD